MGYELYPKILKVYDEQGNKIEIGAIKGEQGKQGKQGEPGKDAVTDLKFDPKSKNAQSGIAIAEELQRPEFRTLRVDIQVSPISRTEFYSNYSSTEIKNFVDAGGDVEAHFEDTIRDTGDQIYQYAKYVQNEKKVYFFRPFSDEKSVSRIALTIDENKNANFTEVVYDGATTSYVNEKLSEKVDHSVVVVNDSVITQADARDVLEFSENYSGALIEFISHTLNRTIGFGWVISNTDIFLITIDYNGIITQWHKDSFEKHYIESYSYINEVVDIDNLTVDVAGNAPFMASVNNAFNRPFKETTSEKGKVFVIPYSIDCQVQVYMDVKSMKMYSRLIEGTADNHSFGVWQEMGGGVSQTYVEQNFANTIRNEAEGAVISVNDVSPFPQIVETKVESENIFNETNLSGWKFESPYYNYKLGLLQSHSPYTISIKLKDDSVDLTGLSFGVCVEYSESSPSKYKWLINNGIVKLEQYTFTEEVWLFAYVNGANFENVKKILSKYSVKIEKGTVATPYTPYIPDLTQARLSVGGKQLVDYHKFKTIYEDGTTTSINGGAILVQTNHANASWTVSIIRINNLPKYKKIYFKAKTKFIGNVSRIGVSACNGQHFETWIKDKETQQGVLSGYVNTSNINKTINSIGLYVQGEAGSKCEFSNIIISAVDTDFESYQCTEYPVNSDGTVPNVQSVSPNMTAFGEGLYVSMKYNADTKKYIDNKFNELTKAVTTAQALALEV